MPTLVIGNKNYSSWSLRPWLAMRAAGIAFEEMVIPLDEPETKALILDHSPAGKVPILVDGPVTVWESLAILEYIAEAYPESRLWPEDRAARAHARAISAEMHAGFGALRDACPMNLRKRFACRDRGGQVARDVERIQAMWLDCRQRFGADGPFLFGTFSAADAMYAPVVSRFHTYSIPVDGVVQAYMGAVMGLPAFNEWRRAALAEPWTLLHDEVDEPELTSA
jgi:glutathione S-transferase